MLTKTYSSLASTFSQSIYDKTAAKKRWSLSKIVFLDVETTFRHIFPSNNLHRWPRGDPRNFFRKHKDPISGNSLGIVCWIV